MSIFDQVVERRDTNSYKWGKLEEIYSISDASNVLPMWVADMDFAAPKAVIDAITNRLQHPVFGYSFINDSCFEAVIDWNQRRYQWTISQPSIIFQQGVIPAIATIIETFTDIGDQIAISTPNYPPFVALPTHLKRTVVTCPMQEKDGMYHYDFNALEEAFKNGVKLYIFCNPHNPFGKLWSTAEIERIIDLCKQYDVLLLADEIHADLTYSARYTPTLTATNARDAKIISCIAPTKTFNLAGIQAAMMVVPDEQMRMKLESYMQAHGQLGLNVFSSAAVEAAYRFGENWLNELLPYLERNIDYVAQELNALNGIHVNKPEGTYLVWIDYRETGLSEEQMVARLLNVGQLALEPGSKFNGEGFLRMNIACPFSVVQDGVSRFKKALQ